MRRRHLKRLQPVSQINVVPYIDVMLVLLIIFMVTAPLLNLGVEVELPQADANPVEEQETEEPLIVTVNRSGDFFLNHGENQQQALDQESLLEKMRTLLQLEPGRAVLVRGDHLVPYGRVMNAMIMIQQAGAPSVGLVTDPPEE